MHIRMMTQNHPSRRFNSDMDKFLANANNPQAKE